MQRGQRLLMSGATGGIGVYALQLAKHMGAHISAQGRAWHEADLLRMGADRFIEYTQEEILHSDETLMWCLTLRRSGILMPLFRT